MSFLFRFISSFLKFVAARSSRFLLLLMPLFLLSGCVGMQKVRPLVLKSFSSPQCRGILEKPLQPNDGLTALNKFSELVEARCHKEAIVVGRWIRDTFREKTYSVSSEVFSVLIPEDAMSEYVMESYERAYLSFQLAGSYLALGKPDEAAVELRRSSREGTALIYNYGEDPVNSLLLAAVWENLGEPNTARPYWKKLTENPQAEPSIRSFATDRMKAIDNNEKPSGPWRIMALGRFPQLDWSFDLFRHRSGYYELTPKSPAPIACRSLQGARESAMISTQSWLNKIQQRYTSGYHPLLNLKSWVRLPIGIAYGLTTFSVGASIAVSGCIADIKGDTHGELCRASIAGGGYLISKSPEVVDFALKPDTRHWEKIPAAIYITRAENLANASEASHAEECWQTLPNSLQAMAYEVAAPLEHVPALVQ
jgi:hypothetical protein